MDHEPLPSIARAFEHLVDVIVQARIVPVIERERGELPAPLVVSMAEAENLLQLSRPKINELLADGKLRRMPAEDNRRVLIVRSSIDDYLARC